MCGLIILVVAAFGIGSVVGGATVPWFGIVVTVLLLVLPLLVGIANARRPAAVKSPAQVIDLSNVTVNEIKTADLADVPLPTPHEQERDAA
ncbi:MAG: hypothetical protein ACRD6W_11965 [Nitrososphaerales archaeon]